jgi:branched-chain amino acid transport system permease protein
MSDAQHQSSGADFLRSALIIGAATVLLAFAPVVSDVYWLQLGYRSLQLLTLALAWNLLAGYTGQVSLGTAAFVGLGAYAMTELGNHTDVPYLLSLPLCGAVAAVFAIAVSPGMFRLRGLYFTIATLALAAALRILVVNVSTFGGASGLILRQQAPSFTALYWIALGLAACASLIVMGVLALPFSLSLRAVRDDESVAQQMGVRTFQTKLGAFALSAFLMGAVGGLQALKLGAIEPYGAFGMSWTIDTVAVVIIGGMGTRTGAVFGTVLYMALGELLRNLPELHSAAAGVVLLLVIRFAPQGLWPLLRAAWSRAPWAGAAG